MSEAFYQEIVRQTEKLDVRLASAELTEVTRFSGGLPVFPGLTQGSVLFGGASGQVAQDNTNFYWDDTNNRFGINSGTSLDRPLTVTHGTSLGTTGGDSLNITRTAFATGNGVYLDTLAYRTSNGSDWTTAAIVLQRFTDSTGQAYMSFFGSNIGVGTAAPAYAFDVSGDIRLSGNLIRTDGAFRMSGTGSGTTTHLKLGDQATGNRYAHLDLIGDGTYTDYGLRIVRNNAGANTDSDLQHRGTGSLKLTAVDAGAVAFYTNSTVRCLINSSGDFLPSGTGTYNFGNAAAYWNDISYKTLTDRGCLALIAEWEMPDGRKVSNAQTFVEMKPHPNKKTVYGEVMLDYDSVPVHSRKTAPIATEDTEVDAFDEKGKKIKYKKGEKMGSDGVEMTAMFSMMIGAIRELVAANQSLQVRIDKLEAKVGK